MSMDFEAEAHELRWAWGSAQMLTTHPAHLASFEVCLADALRRAYAAGQRAMQARVAERADILVRLAQQEALESSNERDLALASGVVGGATTLAKTIRALEV